MSTELRKGSVSGEMRSLRFGQVASVILMTSDGDITEELSLRLGAGEGRMGGEM